MPAPLSPDTIASSILPSYDQKLRDDFFTSHPIFEFMLSTVKKVDGGLNITQEILYNQNPQADNFPGGVATLPADFIGNTTNAVYPPAYYYWSVAIPDTYAILNRGKGQIIDIISAQYQHALMSLIERIGFDLYSDGTQRNGAPIVWGLNGVITSGSDPGGGAFGGISRAGSSGTFKNPTGSAAWWNGNVLTLTGGGGAVNTWKGTINLAAGTTLQLSHMFNALLVSSLGQYRPLAIFCDLIAFTAFAGQTMSTVRQSPLEDTFRQGPTALTFAGIPIFQDDKCPTGSMYFINDLFCLQPWDGGFFEVAPWRQPSNAMVNIKYGLAIMQTTHGRPNTMTVINGITG